MWQLPLSYAVPPLSLNYRSHWASTARTIQDVQAEIIWQTRALKIPPLTRPTVTLHYQPATKRRRDVDSLVSLSKACLDGIVKAGVLEDDTPAHVEHRMPVLEPVAVPGRIWFEVQT